MNSDALVFPRAPGEAIANPSPSRPYHFMRTNRSLIIVLLTAGSALASLPSVEGAVVNDRAAAGPLRVSTVNPRYFAAPTGQPVYLTGSHSWQNLQDGVIPDLTAVPQPFDYTGYLNLLQTNHHNFIRLWRWELSTHEPQPWPRTGPGQALDGKPRYDLRKFHQPYFDRLRSRVIAARDRGIYVSIMLFEDWIFMNKRPEHPLEQHPFHKANNISGINGDPNGDGWGVEIHTLQIPEVLDIQKAYVRKIIETVNDLDNVLYEICNEGVRHTREWQYEMVRFVKDTQARLPKQHPVGMTSVGDMNPDCLKSDADWTSLATTGWDQVKDPWASDPPAADGQRVDLLDTDHIGWKIFIDDPAFTRAWVWKSFLRGHNALLMENLAPSAGWIAGRAAMGHARRLAERVNLAALVPNPELASTGYCLADPGREYVVYLLKGGEVTVDLSGASGTLAVEWIDPANGTSRSAEAVSGGGRRTLQSPFTTDAVVYLSRSRTGQSTVKNRVIKIGFSLGKAAEDSAGGMIVADVDNDRRMDFLVTAPGHIAVFSNGGKELWRKAVAVRVGGQSESQGLPGHHGPGLAAADIDGDGRSEVVFLTEDSVLHIVDGATGKAKATARPPFPPGAARWEVAMIATLQNEPNREILLQTTNEKGYRMGKFLTAYRISDLLDGKPPLWSTDKFISCAHNGARLADLNADGLDEILGATVLSSRGRLLVEAQRFEGHMDSVFVADVVPGKQGLEVVQLEEGSNHVQLLGLGGPIWRVHHQRQEPQNATLGRFKPGSDEIFIWCRSRYNEHQKPFVFDSRGQLVAEFEMDSVAPEDWTKSGVEVIHRIDWTGQRHQLACAKERHKRGDVCLFEPLTGKFVQRIRTQADRLYVADVSGDWREEIIVVSGDELQVYENQAANPRPDEARLWDDHNYTRMKHYHNYYSP